MGQSFQTPGTNLASENGKQTPVVNERIKKKTFKNAGEENSQK